MTVVVILFCALLLTGRQGLVAKLQTSALVRLISVRMEVLPGELLSKPSETPYRLGDRPHIKVVVVNESDQPIRVYVVDVYYQNRPRLLRNGQLVTYKKAATQLIGSKDSDPHFINMGRTRFVEPYSSAEIQELDLSDWYGPLEPGSYRLTNRYRAEIYGSWTVDSAPLLFEVVKQRQ